MSRRRGVTLIEMLIVVTLVALIVGISFPAVSAGLENLRLASAADSLVSFLNGAMNRSERRQQAMALMISLKDNAVWLESGEPPGTAGHGYTRRLEMPLGVAIEAVLPRLETDTGEPRQFLFLPGGTAPRIGIQIANRRGQRRVVRVDPITGVPRIERLDAQ